MRLLTLIAICLAITSCAKKETTSSGFVGSWKRTETLMDIGNGSGQWSPVPPADQVVVSFRPNGSIVHNGHWYLSRFERYALLSDKELRLYSATDSLTLTYLLEDKLTINFQCIEACRDRFTRVEE